MFSRLGRPVIAVQGRTVHYASHPFHDESAIDRTSHSRAAGPVVSASRSFREALANGDIRRVLAAQASASATQYLVTTALAIHLVEELGAGSLWMLSTRRQVLLVLQTRVARHQLESRPSSSPVPAGRACTRRLIGVSGMRGVRRLQPGLDRARRR